MRAMLTAVLAGCWAASATAQARPPGPDSLTRRALALAYLGVEIATRQYPLGPDVLGPFNRAFDQITLGFFGGRYQEAIRGLDSLATSRAPDPQLLGQVRARALAALDQPAGELRLLAVDDAQLRYRVYRPSRLATPVRLVVAFHGAGADETAFIEGYGAGRLRELADSVGFLLVTPFTNSFLGDPNRWDRLLADLASVARYDRVYALGHSLGAGVVWRLAQERPRTIAAAVALAGAGGVTAQKEVGPVLPPTLLVAAEFDPITPPARLELAAAAATNIGWLVERRSLPNQGHTMMVGASLDSSIRWMFAIP